MVERGEKCIHVIHSRRGHDGSLLYAPFAMDAVEATALRSGRWLAVSPVYRWLTAITE